MVAERSAKIGELNGRVQTAGGTNHHASDSGAMTAIPTKSCARIVKVCHVLAGPPRIANCLRKAAVVQTLVSIFVVDADDLQANLHFCELTTPSPSCFNGLGANEIPFIRRHAIFQSRRTIVFDS